MGFFYLCRPGEAYAPSSAQSDSAPFRMCDVELVVGTGLFRADSIPMHQIQQAHGVHLEFTRQKNCNAGEKIAHGVSGDPIICPTKSVARLVYCLRLQHATQTTPLYCVDPTNHLNIHARHITAALQHSARTAHSTTGIDPDRITARSLQAGGATALLCAKVDPDTIKLVGRWQSNTMLRYLHVQAVPAMQNLTSVMLQHGVFTFQPQQLQPDQAIAIVRTTT